MRNTKCRPIPPTRCRELAAFCGGQAGLYPDDGAAAGASCSRHARLPICLRRFRARANADRRARRFSSDEAGPHPPEFPLLESPHVHRPSGSCVSASNIDHVATIRNALAAGILPVGACRHLAEGRRRITAHLRDRRRDGIRRRWPRSPAAQSRDGGDRGRWSRSRCVTNPYIPPASCRRRRAHHRGAAASTPG